MNITRRSFIKGTIAAGAAAALPSGLVWGANDRVNVAIIGLGDKGHWHLATLQKNKRVRIVGVCDPDTAQMHDVDRRVRRHRDIRELLERKDVDGVVIATPNHWHTLATIWACQAGKDVYVEKPLCHNIWEGRRAVEAARKYNRIVQVGSQKRSEHVYPELIADIRKGTFGRVKVVRGFCYKPRGSIGKVAGPQKPPATVDYNLYQGPAPLAPLMRKHFHYDWHWQWPTGCGDIGNQGIHEIDICRWIAGYDKAPLRVLTSLGGRFGYDDDSDTPNTQSVILDYGDVPPIVFEVRGLPDNGKEMPHYRGVRIGNVVDFEDGVWCNGYKVYDKNSKVIKQYKPGGAEHHHDNWLDAIQTRKPETLNADVLQGHRSAILFHLANISYRLGRSITKEQLEALGTGKDLRAEIADRFRMDALKHETDFNHRHCIQGLELQFDSDTERCTGNGADLANALLTRDYRAPFIVPEKV